MALRLDSYVEWGEIYNTHPYSVHGYIKFWGKEQPLIFELTGNPSPDLAGKMIQFEARPESSPWAQKQVPDKALLKTIAMHQIGPTGTMTIHRAKVPDCTPEELGELYAAGKPISCQWKRCLYLEWYSQNGRVVIDLVDPILHLSDGSRTADQELIWTPYPEEEWDAPSAEEESAPGQLSCTVIRLDENGEPSVQTFTPASGSSAEPWDEESEEEASSYEEWLEGLEHEETVKASGTDLPPNPEDPDEAIRELELMDDLIENDPGVPLRTLIDRSVFEHDLEELEEDEAEDLLKAQLAKLALYGIALHMCEHYSPRDALRLLLDELGKEGRPFPALRGTGWVTNYLTSEYCPECDAEFEKKYQMQQEEE